MALEIISSFCQRHGNIELTVFTNPIAGIEQVKKIKPNILFLDIEMEDINGRDLARDLPHEVMLIFTTAYAQYALDGFELNAIDFLHKPFSYARFEKQYKSYRATNTTTTFRSTNIYRRVYHTKSGIQKYKYPTERYFIYRIDG